MTYDHWKTTEPQSGYDPSEPSIEEEFDRRVSEYEERLTKMFRLAMGYRAERDEALEIYARSGRYADALRRIVGWEGYIVFDSGGDDYAHGANDMLATLKKIAEEALK